MNRLLSTLQEVCESHPLQEKILIVPGYSQGHELCEALARSGVGWVNLRPETTAGLAQQIAGKDLAEKGITLLTGLLTTAVVEEVYQSLEKQKVLRYFAREGNSPGLVRAIASSLYELRNYGISSDSLSADSFVNKDKGYDMVTLLKAYEQYLEEHLYIDNPGLISSALSLQSSKKTTSDADNFYLIPSFLQLSPLEAQLIEILSAGRLVVLPADPVYGLSRPNFMRKELVDKIAFVPAADVERLPWLYQVDQSPTPVGDASLSCFQAYGLTNEVKEIFRRIMADGLPLDSVTVAYTNSEYIPIFYTLAKRTGIKLTFAEGIPGAMTAPGRVLQGLVDWIRNDYSASTFRALLLSGDVRLRQEQEEATLTPAAAARVLRSSGIGWGRDRYVLLKRISETLKEKVAEEGEEEVGAGRREQYLRQSAVAERLYAAVNPLLAALPVPDSEGNISFRELTAGLSYLLSEITHPMSEIDAAALKGLINDLIQTGQFTSFDLEIDEALERVENLLCDFQVGASGPKPGHLHLVSYTNLIWSCRPNTFMAGLGADNFPGSGHQDPVLLDTERLQLHAALSLIADRPSENRYMMALMLASRRGRVTLSFPSFDVLENRSIFPANVLLQAFRLLHKDNTFDYTDFLISLDRPAGYCPKAGGAYLDETEWWAGKVLTGSGMINSRELVRNCYQDIELGCRAMEARVSPEPTEYDGMLEVAGQFDPRQDAALVMSCSRIEDLAGCPFAYFLKYILHVFPPDEVSYDPNSWLDALERGSLLHELYCRFMKKLNADSESPSLTAHRSMMMEMADELIEDYIKRIPPPSDLVFQREKLDIYRSCEVFLSTEKAPVASTPLFFEVPFGLGAAAVAEANAGLADPVKIDLGGGSSFLLRGKIDRIDKSREGVYHIWDYKTGSTYDYEEHKHLRGGRQIQHALYAIAAEYILKDFLPVHLPKVEKSGYYFPTQRGEGLRLSRPQAGRQKIVKLLKHLFDLLAGGTFIASDHGEKCGICDYHEVCNRERAVARAIALASPGGSPCLEPWRRLKEYE